MAYIPPVAGSFPAGPSYDAFVRLRVAEPNTIFDSKLLNDNRALFWDDQQISGGGTSTTYNTNQASVTLAVSNATAGRRVRQTYRRFLYQPGKSQLIFMTGVLGASAAGITRRIGLYDDQNGVFFESAPDGIAVVIRTFTSGVALDSTRVLQANWNIDRMDGTGPSGITLDPTKTQIFTIDFEWLGVGSVRFALVVNGKVYPIHQQDHANSLALVYMGNPNLPLRYEIINSGAGGAASIVHICSTVISEGGREETGLSRSVNRSAALTIGAGGTGTTYPLVLMRLRSGWLNATVRPQKINVVSAGNDPFRWQLLLAPTIAGVAPSYSTVTNSGIEADVARVDTTTISAFGTVLASGYGIGSVDTSWEAPNDFTLGSNIAGTAQILALSTTRLSGAGSDAFYGSIDWLETV